ncbi:Aristolochene synthase [Colletotrichum fructicola]|uniref:Terpene synthase n=1 Tax=Colletotrichum fructicola (strain Nara gc5) TaxID=1213859 RepID=L2FCV4_COLFN|nr:Aristolochene synthase [Colletotrichum fructicola]KAE9574241.1 Aristolochene synthase [Colletotrichum fructicola]KAF4431566.1 Aristolochene synthase [Colletotrichum fructicola]KAF4474209.1 Aristolochene synthase [Colletotrichum fructicola Nara gc5]KAF4884560.1 Aristolochene synthase [Colletotrichum fructicola]
MPPSILNDYDETSVFIGKTADLQDQPASTAPAVSLPSAPQFTPPPSRFIAKCHPLEKQITAEVDGYFLTHWPFKTAKDRKKFVAAGFSRVTCLYFPLGLDDRIHLACRLLTILFLIDDILEDMSLEDGCAYNEKLMPIARGDVQPDRNVPVEWIMYDLWEMMRSHDRQLADDVLEPTFTFMRAQTDKARLSIRGMGPYLIYREKDVGKALLCSLMRFSMGLRVSPEELASAQPIEQNVAKHLSVLNDILSWDKEFLAAQTGHPEGSALCSAVQVLADETSLTYAAAKRVLWVMCREWEYEHDYLVQRRRQDKEFPPSDNLMQYIKGLEYQISGNEIWSKTTLRYNAPTTA